MTDIKKVTSVDQAIIQLPDYNKLGRLTKLMLNPKNIPDLDWQLASELHITPVIYSTKSLSGHTISTTQATSTITAEIITKSIKLKKD